MEILQIDFQKVSHLHLQSRLKWYLYINYLLVQDVRRTFPDDPMFRKEDVLHKLKNVLLAYSRRNITIGYCQGFNFIVGRLLKIYTEEVIESFLNQEEAFWVFVQIVENYLPLNYYSNMCGVMVDSAIINQLLEIYLPDLYNHIASLGYEMNLNNIIYKWLVSIYAHNLPEKVVTIFCYFSIS